MCLINIGKQLSLNAFFLNNPTMECLLSFFDFKSLKQGWWTPWAKPREATLHQTGVHSPSKVRVMRSCWFWVSWGLFWRSKISSNKNWCRWQGLLVSEFFVVYKSLFHKYLADERSAYVHPPGNTPNDSVFEAEDTSSNKQQTHHFWYHFVKFPGFIQILRKSTLLTVALSTPPTTIRTQPAHPKRG